MKIARKGVCAGVVAGLVGIAGLLGGCGSSSSSGSSGSTTSQGGKTIKVAAVLIGPKNDKGFDQAAYDGILAAEKANPRLHLTAVLENRTTVQQVVDGLNTVAPLNQVVVGVTSLVGPALSEVAPKFPNTYFLQTDGFPTTYFKNVSAWANDWAAPLYVAGVVAAHLTKTKVIGYVGGAVTATDTQSVHAFVSGAKSVDPSIKVLTNLTGSYDDIATAKAATSAMISQNADVIMPYLDSGTAGAYAAGQASGKNPAMFRITSAACNQYPNMIGTAVDNLEIATKTLLVRYAQGQLQPGTIFTDLAEPQLQTFALCPKYQQNKAIAAVAQQTISAINSGKIKIPRSELWPRPSYPYREGFNGTEQNAGKTS